MVTAFVSTKAFLLAFPIIGFDQQVSIESIDLAAFMKKLLQRKVDLVSINEIKISYSIKFLFALLYQMGQNLNK
jgi:hypothetical protein